MIKPSGGCALFNLGERLVFMDIRDMLHQVKSGEMDMDTAEKLLKDLPYEELGYAKLDHHRKLRSGFGEAEFFPGKKKNFFFFFFF